MNGLSALLVNAWYKGSWWLYALLPLAWLYRLCVFVRRYAYQQGWLSSYKFTVPVIVVGNITVGGTGKTPLVIALVKALTAAGYKSGVVSRGYGGHAPAYPCDVNDNTPPDWVGDEPLLIARRTAAAVVVDPNRVSAVTRLLALGCDVVIADDGLQHYRLQRDIEIAVLDSARLLGNGWCLPAGPLREVPARLNEVNFLVLNGGAEQLDYPARQYPMLLQASRFIALDDDQKQLSLTQWRGSKLVHAVAGIGHPERFFNTLRQMGFTLIEHRFADHYQYQFEDLTFADDLPVIMTEKDAVKAASLGLTADAWYLPVDGILDDAFFAELIAQLPPSACQSAKLAATVP